MITCPACGVEQKEQNNSCCCGFDLDLLWQLHELADNWYNLALKSLEDNNPGRALEWLSACCIARPGDEGALIALAKVWTQLGHPLEAKAALERLTRINPNHPEVEQVLAVLRGE